MSNNTMERGCIGSLERGATPAPRVDHDRLPISASTYADMQVHLQRARRLQGEAIGWYLGAVVGLGGRALGKLVSHLRRYRQRVRTYNELAALDDHLLRDIGLRRDLLTTAAAGGVARKSSADEDASTEQCAPAETFVDPALTGDAANEKSEPNLAA